MPRRVQICVELVGRRQPFPSDGMVGEHGIIAERQRSGPNGVPQPLSDWIRRILERRFESSETGGRTQIHQITNIKPNGSPTDAATWAADGRELNANPAPAMPASIVEQVRLHRVTPSRRTKRQQWLGGAGRIASRLMQVA